MRARLSIVFAALAVAGCGPTPPQAPLPQAKMLDTSTGGISYACGQASQATAFGPSPATVASLERKVASDVRGLVAVYRRKQTWIYQGETVRKIAKDAASMLRSCGLHTAARTLARATG